MDFQAACGTVARLGLARLGPHIDNRPPASIASINIFHHPFFYYP